MSDCVGICGFVGAFGLKFYGAPPGAAEDHTRKPRVVSSNNSSTA